MNKLVKRGLLVGLLAIALAGTAYAHEPGETGQAKAAERREAVVARLEGIKLQACRRREQKINQIMSRIANRGARQLEVFNKISDRVQTFAQDKAQKPANYDDLVAEVAAKKQAATDAVATIQGTTIEFTCDGSDPKGAADSFKSALKSEISALKDYKTAIKNLIVGVKSAKAQNGASEGGEE